MQASHHITVCHPTQPVPPEERSTYDTCYLVAFQRGFERFTVRCYCDKSDNCTVQDAEDAVFEYLMKHSPDSLTEEEKETLSADSTIKVRNPYYVPAARNAPQFLARNPEIVCFSILSRA